MYLEKRGGAAGLNKKNQRPATKQDSLVLSDKQFLKTGPSEVSEKRRAKDCHAPHWLAI